MTYPFDTDDLSDLTDEQIRTALDEIGSLLTIHPFRAGGPDPYSKAVIALARLMRDHPELFPKPVDPLLEEAREIAYETRRNRPGGAVYPDSVCEKIKAGEWDDHMLVQCALTALKRHSTAKGGEA